MADIPVSVKEGTAVFRCGSASYDDLDVIHAAWFRGELQPLWNELLRRIECEEAAGDAEPDDATIESAVEQFRYDHDLITAEETEKWLEARELSLEDLSAYFSRRFWGEQSPGIGPAAPRDYPMESAEAHALLRTELFLGDAFEPLAAGFACRVAAAEKAQDVDLTAAKAEFFERTGVTGENLPATLNSLGRDEAWFAEMLRLEAVYQEQCAALLTPQARQREMANQRLALTRLRAEVLELDSQDAAREAALCVQMDGLSVEEVARENGYPFQLLELLVEDIGPDIQQKLLNTPPGNFVEEIPRGDGFQLVRIIEKVEPAPDDPDVRARVDRRILDQHFGKLAADRIHWQAPFGGAQ